MDVAWSRSDAFDQAKWEPELAVLLENGWQLCGDKHGKPNGLVRTISFQKDLQREAFDRCLYAMKKLGHHDPEDVPPGNEFQIHYTTHVPDGLSPKDIVSATRTDALVTLIKSFTPLERQGEPIVTEKELELMMQVLRALGQVSEARRLQSELHQVVEDEKKRRIDGGSRM